ncbi:MAG: TRAP transporter large permease subunit [Deltaproteobacteria bacterium]|nr:TRAP transporter large permease subunit [Deltaproteobacteria bacterium]
MMAPSDEDRSHPVPDVRPTPADGVIRRLDGAVFRLEQGMFAVFLIAITVFVFLEVVQRRLAAPDSRLGKAMAILLFIDDAGTRAFIDAKVAPFVGIFGGLAFLYFAFRGAERARGRTLLPFAQSAAVLTIATAGIAAGFGWLILHLHSRDLYLTLYGLGTAAVSINLVRRRPQGHRAQLAALLLLVTPAFLWLALRYFPQGYTWGQEISMLFVLWVGFFGASVCVHEGKHIRLEALEKATPPGLRRWVGGLSHVVAAVFSGFMAWLGWRYVFHPEHGMLALGGVFEQTQLPTWIMGAAVPVAFGLTALRFLGAGVSTVLGGSYGAAAKAEGLAEAEAAAKARGESVTGAQEKPKKPIVFFVVVALIVLAPLLGKGGILVAAILAAVLLAEPLFVVLGLVTVVSFLLWSDISGPSEFSILIERIVSLADNRALLAIPLFIMSGAIMARGVISRHLIAFADALVGWLPGGLGISAVLACMIFAAISGSSPATVVAIGGMMAPALISAGYRPEFSHGLVTSAGSLGILIPPSIPMIVYAIVNQTTSIEVERLFACGIGPGLVIGGILMGYSIVRGLKDGTPRPAFSLSKLGEAAREGIWALFFPVLILAGIYLGVFTAVESAGVSVIYAIVVEVWIYRSLKLADIPKVFAETGVLLGSFLVILVVAMSFGEFLEGQQIPAMAADSLRSMDLEPWQFLLAVNLLLLVVGCLMDIMSAMFVFVPLLAPMAMAVGVDPMHFGIIFIVNLEIGYLTPPVGLNLFVSSTLFGKPMTYLIRAVVPFILLMMIGLAVITYVPSVSVGLANAIMGEPQGSSSDEPPSPRAGDDGETAEPADRPDGGAPAKKQGVQSIDQMMRELEGGEGAAPEAGEEGEPAPGTKRQRVQTIEEMMRDAERSGAPTDGGTR